MTITNGTFDTDLNGWTYTSAVSWEAQGRARIYAFGYSCPRDWMEQTFIITAPTISFDYIGSPAYLGIVTVGWDFIVEGNYIISSEIIAGASTRILDVSSYIGKSATIRFKLIAYGGNICVNDYVSLIIDNVTNTGGTPVLFSTFPTGATIIINGTEIVPKTNVQINYPVGTYDYILRLPCYEDVSGQINVVVGPPISVIGSFVLNTGGLSIVSQPPGAAVYYGPAFQGNTPLNYPSCYPEGIYNYNISLLGYQPFVGSASVTRGLFTEVNAPLIAVGPPGQGSLYLSSDPSGASIYIDNVLQIGQSTPTTISGLTTGSHSVKVKLDGYYTMKFPVTIGNNVTTNISLVLTPSTQVPIVGEGCLSFGSNPQGAQVTLDGTDTGELTPTIICGLTLGLHTYELTLAGHRTITGDVTLGTGQGETINQILVPCTPNWVCRQPLDGYEHDVNNCGEVDRLNPACNAPLICQWITSKGGWAAISAYDIMTLVNAYLGLAPLGFTVTMAHINGAISYYLDIVDSGNTLTGCTFV